MYWIIFLLVFAHSDSAATDVHAEIEYLGFVETPSPPSRLDSSEGYQQERFLVRIQDGNLAIEAWEPRNQYLATYHEVFGNEYRGYDGGEWGGKLTLTTPSGHEEVLLEDNIRSIHPVGDDLLVFTGLGHLGLSRGAVFRVIDAGYSPTVQKVTLLPEVPYAIVADLRRKDLEQFLIVGRHMLITLFHIRGRDYIRVSSTPQENPWPGATSAVMMEDTLVVGMRGGIAVAEIDNSGRFLSSVRYFVPDGVR